MTTGSDHGNDSQDQCEDIDKPKVPLSKTNKHYPPEVVLHYDSYDKNRLYICKSKKPEVRPEVTLKISIRTSRLYTI